MLNWITALIAHVLVATIGGYVAGRLLGVRLSWGRWLVALAVGASAGGVIAWLLAGRPMDGVGIDPGMVLVATVAVALVAAADPFGLLGPPGRLARVSTGVVRIPRLWSSARRRVANGRRYAQVVRIAARHGLVERAAEPGNRVDGLEPLAGGVQPRARRLGRALRLTLEEAGGAFVKLGQILSTRPDLLPADVIDELARLQDDVAPAPRDDVDAVLAAELGETPQRVFTAFAADPLAAASIAQVHRATLADGGTVAVKVRRPGIRAVVDRDLAIARQLAAALEARVSWARDVGVVDLAEGFAAALLEEVDFTVEARNTISCREALDQDAIVRIPAVHQGLSTEGVLVVEWMDGVAVRGAEQLIVRAGLDRPALARGLLEAVLRQIMVAGVFHADPHPGNVLVRADGTLALIDFGSVGRLSSPQQSALLRALLAMSQRDPRQLRDALLDLASARSATDEDLLEAALGQFLMQRLADRMRPDPALFADLLRLMLDFGLAFPPAVAAVFRALFTLDGTLTLLDPGFNILDEAKASAAGWIDRLVMPDAAQEVVTQEALSLLPVLRRLPRRIDRIASAAERGDFGVNVRLFADRRDVRVVNDLVNRALLAFISVAVGLISVQLLDGAANRPLDALTLLGYVGLVVSVVLVLRTLVEILRADR